ncbi:hypothetical protein H6G00_05130 [Leptolyngbya sp. FACHB-541]|uniref:hypothetical protein n=1 Tax=Leptolyngbya sp. FACHB-541 TaxID=2692810 RepID=UPI001684CBC4|nr:hypothetical protein [Leptolyngbya sp. FACHB-541]MBD1995999.1 hypothetical protein [Leptolyngbya sp. FACHB-541]
MEEPIQPIGEPLPLEELLKLATPTQGDLDRAIATADRSLKPFLTPKQRQRR